MKNKAYDPALYRRMSVPFESIAAADQALESFAEEFCELRKKWKIPDIVAVIEVTVLEADGQENVKSGALCLGDINKRVVLLAMALGREQREMESEINRLRKGGG